MLGIATPVTAIGRTNLKRDRRVPVRVAQKLCELRTLQRGLVLTVGTPQQASSPAALIKQGPWVKIKLLAYSFGVK